MKHISCYHCGYRCTTKRDVAVHIQARHLPRDPNTNKCEKCGKNFSTPSNLKAHSKICDLLPHERRLFRPKRFVCYHCERSYQAKSMLAEHIKASHLPSDPEFNQCKKCKKNFSNRSNLNKHWRNSCGASSSNLKAVSPIYYCDHCDYKSPYKWYLACHIKRKHLKDPSQPKKCYQLKKCYHCDYEHRFKSVLANHIRQRHLPRDRNANKCEKCGKSFSQRSNLNTHVELCGLTLEQKLMLRPKRFSCDYCDYKSQKKYFLDVHIQNNHLPADPDRNKCNKCNRNFSTVGNLKKHLNTCGVLPESKDKNISCEHCDLKYHTKSLLTRHIKVKHLPQDPNLYKCILCGMKLSCKSVLNTHQKKYCRFKNTLV